ncbi:hypothetical protein U3516DRAFT_733234 [Neocallimastix sp. 'constans']
MKINQTKKYQIGFLRNLDDRDNCTSYINNINYRDYGGYIYNIAPNEWYVLDYPAEDVIHRIYNTSEMAHDELRQRENDDDETDENLVVCNQQDLVKVDYKCVNNNLNKRCVKTN